MPPIIDTPLAEPSGFTNLQIWRYFLIHVIAHIRYIFFLDLGDGHLLRDMHVCIDGHVGVNKTNEGLMQRGDFTKLKVFPNVSDLILYLFFWKFTAC